MVRLSKSRILFLVLVVLVQNADSVNIGGVYLGCYKDTSGDRDLSDEHFEFKTNNTIENCIGECFSRGYRFASVQYSFHCLCGHSYGKHGTEPETNCAMSCSGNASQTCGGSWANRVYSTGYRMNGHWEPWSSWSSCTTTCGDGTMNRTRHCNNPVPAHGGSECTRNAHETQSCKQGDCPVCVNTGGTCQAVAIQCAVEYYALICPGPANIKCCYPAALDEDCTDKGGVCQNKNEDCINDYQTGLCAGPTDRKCCIIDTTVAPDNTVVVASVIATAVVALIVSALVFLAVRLWRRKTKNEAFPLVDVAKRTDYEGHINNASIDPHLYEDIDDDLPEQQLSRGNNDNENNGNTKTSSVASTAAYDSDGYPVLQAIANCPPNISTNVDLQEEHLNNGNDDNGNAENPLNPGNLYITSIASTVTDSSAGSSYMDHGGPAGGFLLLGLK